MFTPSVSVDTFKSFKNLFEFFLQVVAVILGVNCAIETNASTLAPTLGSTLTLGVNGPLALVVIAKNVL